jgi:putative phosphoesterase
MRVGVLSDTHNLLRPRVLELLAGCDRLLHAGDVGGPEILARLRQIAPVEAVRGNTDRGAPSRRP